MRSMYLGEELYKDLIIEHCNNSDYRGVLEGSTYSHLGLNPLCGDEVEISMLVESSIIKDMRFQGEGCSISQAAASLLIQEILGKSVDEVMQLLVNFRTWMLDRKAHIPDGFGDLAALSGVRGYPGRIKCALLASTVLSEMLKVNR